MTAKETEPDLPVSVKESLAEAWVNSSPPQSRGTDYRNSSRRNEEAEPKQKYHPVVDVSGGESKLQCCKKQYCIGIWNVRSMNQGKLEVVKQ